MARLLLIDGIPGSGKSTLAACLSTRLNKEVPPCACYLEGQAGHPAELEWHACFTQAEFASLCSVFPENAARLSARTKVEGNFYLVNYMEGGIPAFSGSLLSRLRAREFRHTLSPRIPLQTYLDVSLSRWGSLAAEWSCKKGFLLLEAAFLQHPVQDLRLHYSMPEDALCAFLQNTAEVLRPLAPTLFYLAQDDVPKTLSYIAAARNWPEMAYPDSIAFFARRQALELAILPKLPLCSHVVFRAGETPEETARRMQSMLCLP